MDEVYKLTPKVIKSKIGFIKENLNKIIYNKKLKKIISYKESNKIKDIDICEDKNQINNKQKIIKKRNPGIDLIRIVTMVGIVYTHVIYSGKGISKYIRYKKIIIRTHTFVFWHNNAFALISGIVGYKSNKYSNLINLWLIVVFYSVGIRYYYLKFKPGVKVDGELYQEYYPVIYNRYWYFSLSFLNIRSFI